MKGRRVMGMKRWKLTLQVAATYVGTVVGAGFATGKEIVQFFTQYGELGMVGILVSGLFFIWLGSKMMLLSHAIGASSYQQLNTYLFGDVLGKAVNGVMIVILFGVTSVMLASTGAIGKEQFGLWPPVGMICTIVLTYIFIARGINGILMVNSLVVPMMLSFALIIFVPNISYFSLIQTKPDLTLVTQWKWAVSPFLYISLNLALAQAVLVPLGSSVKDKSVIKKGAVIGGCVLTFMLVSTHLALSNLPYSFQLDIPMGAVVKNISAWVNVLFTVVVLGEIFTTLIGNVFGIAKQLQSFLPLNDKQAFAFIISACFIIGQFGYAQLLEFLYPIFGYIGLAFVWMLCIKKEKIS